MDVIMRDGTLSQLVLTKIEQGLRNREYKPGELLPPERELAEKFGVGKSSVREAVKTLQTFGVVTSEQGKGTFIKNKLGQQIMRPMMYELLLLTSPREDLYQFRMMFDSMCLPIAAANATARQKRDAQWAFEEFKDLQRKGFGSEAGDADITFHSIILEATNNQYIEKTGKMILDLCRDHIKDASRIFDRSVIESHEKLLDYFCGSKKINLPETLKQSFSMFEAMIRKGTPKSTEPEK